MPIFYAVATYFGWGTGDIFGTIAARKVNSYSVFVWFEVFSLIFMLPLAIIYRGLFVNFTPAIFTFTVIIALFSNCALVLFYEALKRSNATLIGTLVSSFAAVSVILSIIFLGERISLNQFAAIVLVFGGLVISTLDFKEIKNGKFTKDKAVTFAFIAMILWGIYFTFLKIPIKQVGWFWPGFISATTFPLMFIPFIL